MSTTPKNPAYKRDSSGAYRITIPSGSYTIEELEVVVAQAKRMRMLLRESLDESMKILPTRKCSG